MFHALLLALAAAAAGNWLLTAVPHLLAAHDPAGDACHGQVLFVESIRWLGIPWGLRTCAAGLRRAGFRGRVRYWRWHRTWRGLLVLPAILDARLLERRAERLARYVTRCRRRNPDRPVYLIGYSAGGYVVVRALERLDGDVRVDGAALLAAAVDPRRDMTAACRNVTGRLVVCSSSADWLIIGLGTAIFGTGDRRHTPSMGMLGSLAPAPGNLAALRWRPGWITLGHWGGHFAAAAKGFVAHKLAPLLLR